MLVVNLVLKPVVNLLLNLVLNLKADLNKLVRNYLKILLYFRIFLNPKKSKVRYIPL